MRAHGKGGHFVHRHAKAAIDECGRLVCSPHGIQSGALQARLDRAGGALGIFTTREAAEEFIDGDPFVQNGVVARWTIREWKEVLA